MDNIDDDFGIKWFESIPDEPVDELSKKMGELLSKYEETFGIVDITTEASTDEDRLMDQIETCIRLNIPYSKLYRTKISKNIFY